MSYKSTNSSSGAITLGTSVTKCLRAEITEPQLTLAAAVYKQTTLDRMELGCGYHFRQLLHVRRFCINNI